MALEGLKHQAADMGLVGANDATDIFNDNQGCVDWSAAFTTKGIKHLNLRENWVRGSQQAGCIQVKHISGKLNPSDIFTKEIKDAAHFRNLRDTFIVSKQSYTN